MIMPVNNQINIFLINPNIILYYFLFIKYLWIGKISLLLTGKNFTLPFNSTLIILLILKYFEILPKHIEQSFISEFLALN